MTGLNCSQQWLDLFVNSFLLLIVVCNFSLVLIDSCCSAVMTINLQVFPGFCQILDARAVHWWACVQMLDTGVWSPDNATRTICRYMYLSCRVWLSHVCFFIVKCLTLFFRVYSEWQWILSGVLSLNPSLKRTHFQKKRQNKTKEREKKQWITF